jgi:hypothetical protein
MIRDVLALIDRSDDDNRFIDDAAELASTWGAHLTIGVLTGIPYSALAVTMMPNSMEPVVGYPFAAGYVVDDALTGLAAKKRAEVLERTRRYLPPSRGSLPC